MAAQSTASVTRLPTAASAPVQQPPRRGRFPRGVTHIREANYRSYLSQRIAEYQQELTKLEGVARHLESHADRTWQEAAVLRQQIDNLAKKGGRHAA